MISTARPLDGVFIYSFGQPFETGAFIKSPKSFAWQSSEAPDLFEVEHGSNSEEIKITFNLGDDDSIVGLGQHMGSINCRGNFYRLFSTDNPVHIPSARSMYAAHGFMMILRDAPLGIFIDSAGETIIDVGWGDREKLTINVKGPGCYLTLIEGSSPQDIQSKYLELVGQSYVPPRWAFGYQQSRWSYPDEASVREVATKFFEHQIPCDVIHIDIHYMNGYRVFTVDEKKFPNLSKLASDLREKDIKLITIIDPGVKVEQGYSVYDEGVSREYFCKRRDHKGDFVGAVWPGLTVFPDFFRAEVRKWWGEKYKILKDQGIAGFWNDMNEPAIFYTPEAFDIFAKKISDFHKKGSYTEELGNLLFDKRVCGQDSYYDEFVHEVEGQEVLHKKVHNLYGARMTQAAAEGLAHDNPGKKNFLLSRSSYPGMHRYAAIWTGDNHSWWEHLSLNTQMLMSLNLSGFMFCGADTGGFSGDCSPDLLVRWTQIGCFSPFFRNHAAVWAKNQEPWSFDSRTLELCREIIKVRYSLLPYMYTEYVHSVFNRASYIKGLFMEYSEARARLSDDTFMCGRSLVVAPVVQPGAVGRHVWLPKDHWLRLDYADGGLVGKTLQSPGDAYVGASINETPIFLRFNHSLPIVSPAMTSSKLDLTKIKLIVFTDTESSCSLLLDDGETEYSSLYDYPKVNFLIKKIGKDVKIIAHYENAVSRRPAIALELWSSTGEVLRSTHNLE
jgi:alpha-glucosidase